MRRVLLLLAGLAAFARGRGPGVRRGPRTAPGVFRRRADSRCGSASGTTTRSFQKNAVQLFQRRLDLPVQVDAPWMDALPGRAHPQAGRRRRRKDDRLERRDRARARGARRRGCSLRSKSPGRCWRASRAPSNCPPRRCGTPGARSSARTSCTGASRWTARTCSSRGRRFRLAVKALPADGRPDGFVDAVGDFSGLRVGRAAPRGRGPDRPAAPRREGRRQRRVVRHAAPGTGRVPRLRRARRQRRSPRARSCTTSPRSVPGSIPSIPFAFFDPGKGAYRTVTTEPVPLEVAGAPSRRAGAGVDGRGVRHAQLDGSSSAP